MKKLVILFSFCLFSIWAQAQNSPLFIWGTGLDGSTYQKTAIYSDLTYGLLIEAPKDASGNKLPIQFNWRGGGVPPIHITSSGNVGIGMSSPELSTHIVGTSGFPTGSGTTQVGVLRLQGTGSNGVLDFSVNGGSGATLQVTNRSNLALAYPLILNPNGGNIGIGTTSPSTNLHIGNINGGGIRIGAVGDAGNVSVPLGAQTVQYNLDFSGYRDIQADQIGARISALRFNNYGNNTAYIQKTGLAFFTNPSGVNAGTTDLLEQMRITPEGSLAIGTTDPKGYKLAVAGKAIAEEVTVKLQASWPDYVFNSDYSLLTLEEIKTYIDKNKHLPEVPSAKEMEANGVQLGEMNMLLLKKIEELTLHMIELKKENKKLNERVSHVESKN